MATMVSPNRPEDDRARRVLIVLAAVGLTVAAAALLAAYLIGAARNS